MAKLSKRLDPSQAGHEAEKLSQDLRKLVVGQDDAVSQIVGIYQVYLAGMGGAGRPIGSFLFLGPTGTGKTRLVEAIAQSLVGDARAVLKIDCAEFQHSHEIAKLIGSPPGYLGHRETHPMLSQEALNQYQTDHMRISFVLFDEIEKASDALWNLLLGVLDKATLTLGDNRRVDFSRAMIFMTSNLGATEMSAVLRPSVGFATSESERRYTDGEPDEDMHQKLSRAGTEAARRKFTPEFMNRIDKVAVFRPLGSAQLERILAIEIAFLQQRIFNSAKTTPFVFNLTAEAKEFLLQKGTDLKYGARYLNRAISQWLVHPLSNLIASGQVVGGDLLRVDFDEADSALVFIKEREDVPTYAMMTMIETMPVPDRAVAATASSARTATPRSKSR